MIQVKHIRHRWILPFLFALLLPLAACEKEKAPVPSAPEEKAETNNALPAEAVAELKPTEGNKVSGTVTFSSRNGTVRVVADLEGLEPGKHGFHIHESGDCSTPDATSAGGHFNPDNTPHGAPENPPAQRHVGDLGNLEADADGKAHLEIVDQFISLEGPNAIVGKAVIVHAQPDDLSTQPTGNAGPRVACGVIEAKK
jgi:Cu-Zn family superoxide dismutase